MGRATAVCWVMYVYWTSRCFRVTAGPLSCVQSLLMSTPDVNILAFSQNKRQYLGRPLIDIEIGSPMVRCYLSTPQPLIQIFQELNLTAQKFRKIEAHLIGIGMIMLCDAVGIVKVRKFDCCRRQVSTQG